MMERSLFDGAGVVAASASKRTSGATSMPAVREASFR